MRLIFGTCLFTLCLNCGCCKLDTRNLDFLKYFLLPYKRYKHKQANLNHYFLY
jgi:hypothetical protein